MGGTITLTPALSRHPLAGALLLAAILNAKHVDWEAFFDLQDLLQDSNDRDVQKEIERGMKALRKEHDILEKPLKETKIITGKDKKSGKIKKTGLTVLLTSMFAVIYDASGNRLSVAQQDFEQIFPKNGWVEHSPSAIWESQLSTINKVLSSKEIDVNDIHS